MTRPPLRRRGLAACSSGSTGSSRAATSIHLVICLAVVQSSTYVLLLAIGYRTGGAGADLRRHPAGTPAVDPVVQALTLTDVVVGRHRDGAAARARGAGAQALRHRSTPTSSAPCAADVPRSRRSPVVVPLLARRCSPARAPSRRGASPTSVARRGRAPRVAVLAASLLRRSAATTLVYWFGGWHAARRRRDRHRRSRSTRSAPGSALFVARAGRRRRSSSPARYFDVVGPAVPRADARLPRRRWSASASPATCSTCSSSSS